MRFLREAWKRNRRNSEKRNEFLSESLGRRAGLSFCSEGMQQNPSIIIRSRLCSKMQHLTPYHPEHINMGPAIGRNSSGRPMRSRKTTRTARHVGPPNSRGTGNWQQSLDSSVRGRTLVDQCAVSQCKSRALSQEFQPNMPACRSDCVRTDWK